MQAGIKHTTRIHLRLAAHGQMQPIDAFTCAYRTAHMHACLETFTCKELLSSEDRLLSAFQVKGRNLSDLLICSCWRHWFMARAA